MSEISSDQGLRILNVGSESAPVYKVIGYDERGNFVVALVGTDPKDSDRVTGGYTTPDRTHIEINPDDPSGIDEVLIGAVRALRRTRDIPLLI